MYLSIYMYLSISFHLVGKMSGRLLSLSCIVYVLCVCQRWYLTSLMLACLDVCYYYSKLDNELVNEIRKIVSTAGYISTVL